MITIEQYAEKINLSTGELNGNSREQKISVPRQVWWYYLHENGFPVFTISREFNRKHSTVIHGIKTVKGMIEVKDKTINRYLDALEIFSHL